MPTKCQDSDPLLGGVLYAGGYYSEGGSYMPDYTVFKPPAGEGKPYTGPLRLSLRVGQT